jgi:hypothetical protein
MQECVVERWVDILRGQLDQLCKGLGCEPGRVSLVPPERLKVESQDTQRQRQEEEKQEEPGSREEPGSGHFSSLKL